MDPHPAHEAQEAQRQGRREAGAEEAPREVSRITDRDQKPPKKLQWIDLYLVFAAVLLVVWVLLVLIRT